MVLLDASTVSLTWWMAGVTNELNHLADPERSAAGTRCCV
jgi:hypothetical protein